MIVYVESNLLLEIALNQEQFSAAEKILTLAETKHIKLALPAFALVEPYWTLRKNGDIRRRLCTEVEREIKQLSRSSRHSHFTPQATDIIGRLAQVEAHERISLDEVVNRVIRIGEIIPLQDHIISGAIQDSLDLQPQDAFIFLSILNHLETTKTEHENLFISRNSRDFGKEIITSRLKKFRCRYMASYADAVNFMEAYLSQQVETK